MPFEPIYHINGFNFPLMPIITQQQPDKVQAYSWGLIPHWVKSLDDVAKLRAQTLNARSETLFEKPSFRSYTNNRCLVLADGFYEWMDFAKQKYPHYVHLTEARLFAFAGLYAHWTDKETGELVRTFTIITTDANPLMARIHNVKKRMPLILPREEWDKWLDPNLSREEMKEMLRPCPDTEMKAFTISKLITSRNADTNVPEVTRPLEYPELAFAE
jgi:putative SOS response-associated peptidase YedK